MLHNIFRMAEKSLPQSPPIENSERIGPDDVLLGRGGGSNNHEGNRKFRIIVSRFRSRYLKAKKLEKVTIAQEIVDNVSSNGGRFLQRHPQSDGWIEVSSKRSQEKASQALREGLYVRRFQINPSNYNDTPPQKTPEERTNSRKERKPYTIRKMFIEGRVLPHSEKTTESTLTLLDNPETVIVSTNKHRTKKKAVELTEKTISEKDKSNTMQKQMMGRRLFPGTVQEDQGNHSNSDNMDYCEDSIVSSFHKIGTRL